MPELRSGPNGLSGEASELGLPPGSWPVELTVSVDGVPTVFDRREPTFDPEGDLLYFLYTDYANGRDLRVWND